MTPTPRSRLVLFIHGFGADAEEWQDCIDILCAGADSTGAGYEHQNYRFAAIDMRGYGASDKTPRGYDLTTAASDVAGVIRGLGHSSAIVVGHGYGGMVGWTLAAHEPDRISRLVTLSSAHPLEQAKALISRPFRQWRLTRHTLSAQVPRLAEKRLVEQDGLNAERIFRAGVAPGFRDTDRYRAVARRRRDIIQQDKVAHLALEYQRWMFRARFRPEGISFDRTFPKVIDVPVTAIDGSMDPNFFPSVAQRSLDRSSDGRAELLYGVGHYGHVEDPERVADIIAAEIIADERAAN